MIWALTRFVRDQRGATAIEYGLIAAILSTVIVASIESMRDDQVETFANVANAMSENNG